MKVPDIPRVNSALRKLYNRTHAPIKELQTARGKSDAFKILVSTLLSARTRDHTTALVTDRLFARIHSHTDLAAISLLEIEQLIFPIGFYRTKARHLKQLPTALERDFNGRIPDSIDDLCRLPGVGRKTANLVLTAAFDKHAICVDVHVHRICNRLGLVSTPTPRHTEMELRRILPKRYWKSWNYQLVSFGQTICRPVNPMCGSCPITDRCDHIGLIRNKPPSPEKPKKRHKREKSHSVQITRARLQPPFDSHDHTQTRQQPARHSSSIFPRQKSPG